jgi:hypothetical protein
MSESDILYEKDAMALALDFTRQLIKIAVGGIAFVIGVHYTTPTPISTWLLWTILAAFGVSAMLGLLFLMNSISRITHKKSYDVYATSLRIIAAVQILLVAVGIFLVCLLPINTRTHKDTIEVQNETVRLSTHDSR